MNWLYQTPPCCHSLVPVTAASARVMGLRSPSRLESRSPEEPGRAALGIGRKVAGAGGAPALHPQALPVPRGCWASLGPPSGDECPEPGGGGAPHSPSATGQEQP